MALRIKKTKKSRKQRGQTTYGHGARKKWKKSGHRGGTGMAGTGKRADQKKTLIIKKYGNKYFGKQGITSKKTEKRKNLVINVNDIEKDYDNLMKKYGKDGWLELKKYKILGDGEIKKKIKLKARKISKSALDKIKKAGGEVEIKNKNKSENE
ncbi:uL15 family ribosomal protein [Candidatus Pacearchaeota archaeon]|nr:uL15 family ribosomal protein [Candidatus Pacearchaeota archaeon]